MRNRNLALAVLAMLIPAMVLIGMMSCGGCIPQSVNGAPPTTQAVITATTLDVIGYAGASAWNARIIQDINDALKKGRINQSQHDALIAADQQVITPLLADIQKAEGGDATTVQQAEKQFSDALNNLTNEYLAALAKQSRADQLPALYQMESYYGITYRQNVGVYAIGRVTQ